MMKTMKRNEPKLCEVDGRLGSAEMYTMGGPMGKRDVIGLKSGSPSSAQWKYLNLKGLPLCDRLCAA